MDLIDPPRLIERRVRQLQFQWLSGAEHEKFAYLLFDVPDGFATSGEMGDVSRSKRARVAIFTDNGDLAC